MISETLIKRTFEYFDQHKNYCGVNPSLPILYFGDLEAYRKSDLKVITVGKNPSDNEFKLKHDENFSFCRFPDWDPDKKNLMQVLNAYFEKEKGGKPLKQWFSSFEPILNGLGCSYYKNDKNKNTAIHTDICSPLATRPTWSRLPKEQQDIFSSEGTKLWHSLIKELEPDIIIVSVPLKLYQSVFSSQGEIIMSFNDKKNGIARKKGYEVFIQRENVGDNGKISKVVFGQAANKPFGTISDDQKLKIGQKILSL